MAAWQIELLLFRYNAEIGSCNDIRHSTRVICFHRPAAMPRFAAVTFALTGLAAAAGPLLIHLAHQRRVRVVAWAAMDLLSEALARQRGRLRWRDRTLLVLRTAAIALFGFGMARPYWPSAAQPAAPGEAVHSIVIVDNSLSMGRQEAEGTLFNLARLRAAEFIRGLPAGSQISMLAWCGPVDEADASPRDVPDAEWLLVGMRVVDRAARLADAVDFAKRAARLAPRLKAKRVVLFTDQQASNWAGAEHLATAELPEFEVVRITPRHTDNAWVAQLSLPDGVAGADSECLLTASVRYEGGRPRPGVLATWSIDDRAVACQRLDLAPGDRKRLTLLHRFAGPAVVSLALSPDLLPADDRRYLSVPFAEGAPLLVVEDGPQAAAVEDDESESRPLLDLLGANERDWAMVRGGAHRPLVAVERTTVDALTADLLLGKRLVVMAGVRSPGNCVALLRQYVADGGQLLLAAGGDFDPAAWQQAAWLEGEGILPLPLSPRLIGSDPLDAISADGPFWLDADSLGSEWRFDHLPADELRDILREPVWFKLVGSGKPPLSSNGTTSTAAPQTRVLAALNDGPPLIAEKSIGRGQTVFLASGMAPRWNTLAVTRAALLLDRLARTMLARTFDRTNLPPSERCTIRLPADQQNQSYTLVRPDGAVERLLPALLADDAASVVVRQLDQRGVYRIFAGDEVPTERARRPAITALAVNGPAAESDPRPIDAARLRVGDRPVRLVPAGVTALESVPERRSLWRWLFSAVLIALVIEQAVSLGGTWRRCEQTA